MSIETYQSKQSVKYPSRYASPLYLFKTHRVVVKNERGERVLDTLVKPPEDAVNLGKKTQATYELALLKAPTLEVIQKYLTEMFAKRTVIGYHILMKLEDLGIAEPNSVHDCAKMFNENEISGQQWQMKELCKVFLNMAFKKPKDFYAVSFGED